MDYLTRDEVGRALYLDFEGEGKKRRDDPDKPPVLGGVLCEDAYEWTILDERFREAQRGGTRGRYEPVEQYIATVLERADNEDRRIVHWTSHEADVFDALGSPLGDFGFDLKKPVKPHFKATFAEAKEALSEVRSARTKSARKAARKRAFGLCVQCASTLPGFDVPPSYGKGRVGDWIRYVDTHGARRGTYDQWTKSAKQKWSKLVSHNEWDCRAMEALANKHGTKY